MQNKELTRNTTELRECPFCGGEAEIHKRRTGIRFYAASKKAIPKNGIVERIIEYPNGTKSFEYSKNEYVARCIDSACMGRTVKAFASKEDAIEAWNRRVNED